MKMMSAIHKNFRNHNYSFFFFHVILMVAFGCNSHSDTFHLVGVNNPEFHPNSEFQLFEDLHSPKFDHLIEKYQLDTVLGDEKDEFKRILLLRNWIKSVIRIENHSPHYSGDGYAEGILDAALQGEGFHCSHFMRVENAVMNAYGYVTRVINAGPGVKEKIVDDNHGINEIWSNQYCKWFLSDAKYNHHFEKNGIPLSALEIREEYRKNKGEDITLVKGANRRPLDFDPEFGRSKESFAQTYTWPRWYKYGNRHTIYPDQYDPTMLVYDDKYFDQGTYFRGGKRVDQKQIKYWEKIKDRNAIEWTPNVLRLIADTEYNILHVDIISDTPNLKEYQVRLDDSGVWKKVNSSALLNIPDKQTTTFYFRSVNLANVTGPESKLIVEKN